VALTLLGMVCLSVGVSAQLYWVGGNSSWNNPQAWSLSPNGYPCNCLPNETTDVVFANGAAVSLNENAKCRTFIVQTTENFSISGSGTLTSFGDLQSTSQSVFDIQSLKFDGAVVHNYNNPQLIEAEVELLNGALKLNSNAVFNGGLKITHGDFLAQGRGVVVSHFNATDSHSSFNFNGTKVVVEESINIHPSIDVTEFDETIWPGANAQPSDIQAGNATVAWSRATTCGTGVGQTPFTITASVASNYNGQNISCNGFEDGQATVSVVGGVGPFSYIWIGGNTPGNQQNYNNLGAGTYTVLVNDLGQGITCVDNVQLAEPPQLTVFSFVYTPPTCEDLCDGSGTPIVIGGVQPYDFTWSSGETTQTATQLCNGPNTLEFTDLNGCAFDTTFNIIPNLLLINLTLQDALCFGEASGSAEVNPSGGQGAPYTVTWSDNSNGNTFPGLVAGGYSVIVEDAAGCQVDSTFNISESNELFVTLDLATSPSCPGESDGAIEVSISGGAAPYNTSWTAAPAFNTTDEDPTGLNANAYNLEVTDDNGCVSNLNVTLNDPATINVLGAVTDIQCFGGNTGAIDVTISGGAGGYVVAWTGPGGYTAGNQDISNLIAGDYTISVTDANLCSTDVVFTVDEATEVIVDSNVTQISCNGANDGEIELVVSGGTGPYTAAWTGPNGYIATGLSHNTLAPGDYTITVSDALNCQTIVDITIDEPTELVLQTAITPISCNGASDAAIDLTISGGGTTYDVTWTGPSIVDPTLEDQSNLAAGAYTVEVLDDLGCVETTNVNIIEPLVITVNAVTLDVSCGGFSDGEIDITITGGTAPFNTAWTGPDGFTSTDADIVNLFAGDYTVTVTDFAGCTTDATFTLIETLPLDIALTVQPTTCFGADDAAIELTITGGLAPIVVSWTGPAGFNAASEDIFDLSPGTYNVLVTDANNCFREDVAEIVEPDEIVIDVITVEPLCNGDATGSITLDITGGVPPFNVVWSTGDPGLSISDLAAGVYSANIIDDAGCQPPLAPISLNEPDALDLTIITTQPDCATNSPGTIEAVVTGGTTDYTYQWSGPNAFAGVDPIINNPEDGDYDLTVTDALGCETQGTTTIVTPTALDVVTAPTTPLCEDDLVSVDVTILNGTPAFNVVWTLPGGGTVNTEDITDLPQGTYDLVITDLNNCIYEETFDLNAIDPLTATGVSTPLDCTGDPIGTIDLTISGGLPPYTVDWVSDLGFTSADEDLTNLAADTYTATITDAQNCVVVLEFTLDQVDELLIDGAIQDVTCSGDADGEIDLTLSGGQAPYDVVWTSPLGFNSIDEDISGLQADIYTATVTDATGCENTAQFEIMQPDPIVSNAIVSDVLCIDDLASVDVSASGGQTPFTFTWTFPDASQVVAEDITDVAQGSYTLLIEDQAGCSTEETFDLTAQNPLAASGTTSPLDCTGDPIASIDVTVQTGVAPFNFDWTGPGGFTSTDEDLFNLQEGDYTANITDDQGCLVTLNFTIDPVDVLQVDGTAVSMLCNGDANGSIELNISGGVLPYLSSWTADNGFTSSDFDIFGLEPGTYEVTITDGSGCQVTTDFLITEPAPLDVASVVSDLFCPDDLASVDLTISGGTLPYFVTWTLPGGGTDTNEDLVDVAQGAYTLDVQDNNGCAYNETFDLIATNVLTADGTSTPLDCTGNPIATIELNVSGGVGPYNFDWTSLNGFTSSDQDLTNLVADTYTVVITDQSGCELTLEFIIDPVDVLVIDGTATSPICFGETSGSILLDISGGVQPYTIAWTSAGGFTSSDEDIFDLGEDEYTVVVTDSDNCSNTATFTLVEPTEIVVSSTTTTVVCPDEPISADITITGGGTPYNISWTDESMNATTDEDLIDFPQGVYELMIEDVFGCVYQETFDLTAPGGLDASAISVPLDCSGDPVAEIDLTVSGGIAPYDIVWSSLNGFVSTDEDIFNLLADEYTATITDQGGCTIEVVVTIDQVDELIITGNVTDAACNGEFTGSIELNLVGGIAPYTADWTGPIGFNSTEIDVFDLMAGVYDVVISDNTGCQKTAQFEIFEPQEVTVDVVLSPVVCPNDLISVDATITGGTPGYGIVWTDPNGNTYNTEDLIDVAQGVYDVVITDALNCVVETSVGITPPNVLNINATVTDLDCSGNPIGAIDLTLAGGTLPYDIVWTSLNGFSSTDEDISALEADTYTVTVTDQTGCVLSIDFELAPVQALVVDVSTVLPVCGGQNTGQIIIDPVGGITPYDFLWTGPNGFSSTDQNLDNIGSGNYEVTITDAAGCFIVLPVVLDDLTPIELTASLTPVICRGDETGAIDLTITGGAAPYSIEWTAAGYFSTDEDIMDLASREYVATVTDDNGCEVSEIFEVIELINIILDFETTDSTCGNAEGEITVTATGGDEPLTYAWVDDQGNPVGTDATISNLPAGTYTVTVTDANNCPKEGQVSISDSDGVQLDATQTDVSCAGLSNGSIDLIISGGTGATEVNWVGTNGFASTDEDLTDLIAGIYNAQVEDELGCLAFATIEIQISPNTLDVTGVASDLECGSTDTGSIDITATGGTGDLTYDWTGPSGFVDVTEDISNLEAGDYQVIVTDAETCSVSANFTLLAFEAVDVQIDVTDVTCAGGTDGSISTTVVSGVAPFTFLWLGPNGFTSANSDIALLEGGDYQLTVTDSEGCVFDQTITVVDGNIIDIQTLATEPACLATDGVLEAFVSGGNGGPYSYFWYDTDNGNVLVSTNAAATNLAAGNYYLEVFDAEGCQANLDVALSNSEGDLTTNITDVLCFGQANGAIDLTVNGLTAPYTFDWVDEGAYTADTEDIADLQAGAYTVDIIDASGCFVSGTFDVNQPAEIIIDVVRTDLLCNGVAEGAIETTITGDVFDYVFDWTGPDGFVSTDQNLSNLEAGCYDLVVTGINDCIATTQVCIITPDTLDVTSIPTGIVCNGANTGSIEIEITGGTGAYTTDWVGPDGFTSADEDIFNLFAGQYDLQITDENGCSIQTSVQVDQSDAIVLVADTILPACPGEASGGFNLTISGGFGPYTLTWSDINGEIGTGASISGLSAGMYTVVAQDAAMCETTVNFELQDPEPIVINAVDIDVLCNGENNGSIEIDVAGGVAPYSTFWVGPNGFSSTAEDIFSLEPGTYELTLGDDAGCVVTQQFQIEEPQLLEVSITEIVDATCLTSENGSISIAILGGVEDYSITWTDSDGNTQNTQNLENIGVGIYDLLVEDANGCSFEATALSIGFTGDAVADAGPDLMLCDGDILFIIGENNGATSTWWEDSNGNQVSVTDTLSTSQALGELTYTYFVQDGECIVSDEVVVIFNPLPAVDAGADQEVFAEETATLGGNPTTDSNNLIVWSPSGLLQNDDEQNPQTIELSTSGYFYVEVTDLNGCSASDSTFVLIIPSVDIPSGFTPNGDAMNDQWIIANSAFYPNIQVNIYSRWGEEVFSSNGYNTPWDGTYNGDPLPIGTYYYVIEVNEPQFQNPLTGPVTIVR
jgi:gliding motility-associated-like protein